MPTRNFYGKSPRVIRQRAKALRGNPTPAEKIVWEVLRNRNLDGYKFRRQHPVDYFIVDFICHEGCLVVELDGQVHEDTEQKEYDEGRSFELEELGYKVLRFQNDEVFNDLDGVLKWIWWSLA